MKKTPKFHDKLSQIHYTYQLSCDFKLLYCLMMISYIDLLYICPFHSTGSVLSLNSNSHNTINLQKVLPIARFNIKISSASFDCSTKILKLNMAQTGLIMIIPNFMTIDKMQVSLQADMTSISQTLQIDIRGIWKVGNLNILVTLAYSRSTGITTVTATPDSKTTIQSFMRSVLGLSLPINPSVTFSIKFEGHITPNGLTTLTLANANGNNKYYGIYQKEGKTPAAKGFATEIRRIKLSTAIKKVINVDISGVPFFGTFSVNNLDLTFATKRITSLNLGSLSKSQLLQKLGYTIKKGLTAFIGVPFHKDPLTLTYNNKVLVMTTPKKDLRLDKILSSIVPGSTKLSLPSQLSQIFKVNIETITVRPRQMTINLAYPGALKFADGILSFSQAKVALVIAKTTPKVTTTVSGIINLGGIKFNTRLAPNKQGKYVLTASTNMLNMNALINSLHAAVLPDTISGFMKGIPFLNFKLKNPTMSYTIGVKPLQIKLGGKPIIAGFSTTNTESLIVKTATGTKTILGFELGQLNFADLLMKVTKFNFGGIFPLLKQSITATVTISPISSNKLHFGVGKLASLPVSSGVSITATMHFPKHCDPKDSFCKFAGRLMGSIPLTLKASFASSSEFLIAAYINKLKLSDKITLQSAGLEIVAGKIPRIGLKGSVQLNKPPLLFTASISASTKGLTLKLSVSNCWKKAFEVEWLTLCDFTGSVDFAPPTGIVGFAFGAKIHLGYPNSGHQIQAAGYMGVNIIYPIANYYYVKFTRVTMGSLLKAFNIRFTLPKPLADSGFPEGFLSSFSALGQNLPDAHLSIPPGYRLKGTLDILGFRASADITIDLPKLIDVNVALPAIRVGNLLAMYASASDARKGPYLKAKVQLLPNQYVNIEAKGYLKVLGIALQSSLKITNSHYMYSISGKILHLFEASMDITAPYGNIHHAVFRVKGEFKLDLFKGIINLSKQLFTNKGNIANAAIGKAKQVYQHALNAYNSARRVLDKAKSLLSRLRIRQAMIQEFENCSSSNTCKKAVVQGKHLHSYNKPLITTLYNNMIRNTLVCCCHNIKITKYSYIPCRMVPKNCSKSLKSCHKNS